MQRITAGLLREVARKTEEDAPVALAELGAPADEPEVGEGPSVSLKGIFRISRVRCLSTPRLPKPLIPAMLGRD
jgi:hypothetical protein